MHGPRRPSPAARTLPSPGAPPLPWAELQPLMQDFFALVRRHVAPKHQAGRLKQWLHYLRRHYPEAEEAYLRVRTINAADQLPLALFGEAVPAPVLAPSHSMAA